MSEENKKINTEESAMPDPLKETKPSAYLRDVENRKQEDETEETTKKEIKAKKRPNARIAIFFTAFALLCAFCVVFIKPMFFSKHNEDSYIPTAEETSVVKEESPVTPVKPTVTEHEQSKISKTKEESIDLFVPDEVSRAQESVPLTETEESKVTVNPVVNSAYHTAKCYSITLNASQKKIESLLYNERGYGKDVILEAMRILSEDESVSFFENALEKAKEYASSPNYYSKTRISDKLKEEEFTKEEVQYAVNSKDIDWNKVAVEKAKEYAAYLKENSYEVSKDSIYKCLINPYEGFTEEEAKYGSEHYEDK